MCVCVYIVYYIYIYIYISLSRDLLSIEVVMGQVVCLGGRGGRVGGAPLPKRGRGRRDVRCDKTRPLVPTPPHYHC